MVVEPGTGRLCYRLSGVILHTAREEGAPVPWVPTPHPAPPPQQQQEEEPQGQAGGGTAVDGAGAQQGTPGGSAMEKWIYVTDVEGRLYVHPKVGGDGVAHAQACAQRAQLGQRRTSAWELRHGHQGASGHHGLVSRACARPQVRGKFHHPAFLRGAAVLAG